MTSPRHSWDQEKEQSIAACGYAKRLQRNHPHTCKSCGLIMITVHPPVGLPWHEFTQPGASARIKLDHRPPCRYAEAAIPIENTRGSDA